MALWSRFFGSAGSQAVGVAMGAAAVPALVPYSQDLINAAWESHQSHPLLAATLAQGVAQGQVGYDWAKDEAARTGINQERFDHLVSIANVGPGLAEAFNLWRRGKINEGGFRRAVKRLGLEQEWIDALVTIHDVLLTPSELANARQQGFVSEDRQKADAAAQGIPADEAEIQFQIAGLPPGPATMQDALNRGLIDRATFDQAIREGHTKTKYTDLLFALRQPILSAPEYATLHLKGWITEAEMDAGGALHGFTHDQMRLLYLARGRPAAPGQMATAAARGIDGPAGRPVDREQFLTAIRQSDIRPEYGPMLWDARFLYPPLFQLTRLVQAGAIDADTAREWAAKDRYPPEVVNALHAYWSQGTAAKADTHEAKAQTQLWGTLHRTYMAGDADEATVRDKLTTLGVPAGVQTTVVTLWNEERELIRQRLTAAQVKKAYAKAVPNPATGAPWTRDDALAELLSRGWSSQDANTFLDE